MKIDLWRHCEMSAEMRAGVMGHRRAQFVDRMDWSLSVDGSGLESDAYDDYDSTYLVVSDAGQHRASCRLRPFTAPTMIGDHFLPVFPGAAAYMQEGREGLFEITRFLKAPGIEGQEGWVALEAISEGLVAARERLGVRDFLAVVFRPVSRLLSYQTADFEVLERGRIDDRAADLIRMSGIPARHRRRDIRNTRVARTCRDGGE